MGGGREILEDTSVIMHLVVYDCMVMRRKASAEGVTDKDCEGGLFFNRLISISPMESSLYELNSDYFYIPTKYLNTVVGLFLIVFSRFGLDDTAQKVQQRLLSKKKLVLCCQQ